MIRGMARFATLACWNQPFADEAGEIGTQRGENFGIADQGGAPRNAPFLALHHPRGLATDSSPSSNRDIIAPRSLLPQAPCRIRCMEAIPMKSKVADPDHRTDSLAKLRSSA
jgi:hypothetical protein